MDLTKDHKALESAYETRRYFADFEQIIGYLPKVTEIAISRRTIELEDAKIIQNYLTRLSNTFTALSYKYLMAGRVSNQLPTLLNIDRQESGFPIYQELLQMANDAMQADRHLRSLPLPEKLKQDMVRHILNEHSVPLQLQFAMSHRLYYEKLNGKEIFWAQNDPQTIWLEESSHDERRSYIVHWAVYDSQQNIPVIYILDLEDSGRDALPRDEGRWPQVQTHLMAQSVGALKLSTIARGFDRDFDDLHPKRLRRFHIGPMYSHEFTEQSGPLRDVLAEASGQPRLDWAMAWTIEDLVSVDVERERSGFFSKVDREIFDLDPFSEGGKIEDRDGASNLRRALILPQRAYQILEERNPSGMANVRKYVVGPEGRILSFD